MAYIGLTEAAKQIGICRAWLYRKYLPRYAPKIVGGSPKLTDGQVARIMLDVEAARNGKKGGRPRNGDKPKSGQKGKRK